MVLDDVEGIGGEAVHDPPRGAGTDALYRTRREIFVHLLRVARHIRLAGLDFKLSAVSAVSLPRALSPEGLPLGGVREDSGSGNDLVPGSGRGSAVRDYLHDRIAVLVVAVDYPRNLAADPDELPLISLF